MDESTWPLISGTRNFETKAADLHVLRLQTGCNDSFVGRPDGPEEDILPKDVISNAEEFMSDMGW